MDSESPTGRLPSGGARGFLTPAQQLLCVDAGSGKGISTEANPPLTQGLPTKRIQIRHKITSSPFSNIIQ